jgi:hypothetical protein
MIFRHPISQKDARQNPSENRLNWNDPAYPKAARSQMHERYAIRLHSPSARVTVCSDIAYREFEGFKLQDKKNKSGTGGGGGGPKKFCIQKINVKGYKTF